MCILPLKPIIVASEAIAAAAVISELSTTTSCSNDPSLCGCYMSLHGGWSGCRTGNREKLSNSQVCCLAQLCLAAP